MLFYITHDSWTFPIISSRRKCQQIFEFHFLIGFWSEPVSHAWADLVIRGQSLTFRFSRGICYRSPVFSAEKHFPRFHRSYPDFESFLFALSSIERDKLYFKYSFIIYILFYSFSSRLTDWNFLIGQLDKFWREKSYYTPGIYSNAYYQCQMNYYGTEF